MSTLNHTHCTCIWYCPQRVIWVSSCTVQCIHKTLYILLGSYKDGDEKVDSYNITIIPFHFHTHSLPTISKIHSKTARTGVVLYANLIYVDNQSPAGQQVKEK
jgi:hypothetical protein